MHSYFWLDGVRSDELGIQLQTPVTFSATKKRYTSISVSGRSGDLHISDGAYENVTARASCFALRRNVSEVMDAINQYIARNDGYRRLEVSEEPDVYRDAYVISTTGLEIRMYNVAPFEIEFDCAPQKWLKTGQSTITISQSQSKLQNPGMPAKPLMRVYGSSSGGSLSIEGVTIGINSIDEYIDIDCDTMNAYKGFLNRNNAISAPEFPVLQPGINSIGFSGGITRIEMKPRWWLI